MGTHYGRPVTASSHCESMGVIEGYLFPLGERGVSVRSCSLAPVHSVSVGCPCTASHNGDELNRFANFAKFDHDQRYRHRDVKCAAMKVQLVRVRTRIRGGTGSSQQRGAIFKIGFLSSRNSINYPVRTTRYPSPLWHRSSLGMT